MQVETDSACYHCGEPIPADCNLSAEIDGASRAMCCPGCQAVARLIADSGLDAFYRLRTSLNETPSQQATKELYALYDAPENNQDFVTETAAEECRAQLLLGGITCAACTWLIESALLATAGVSAANVNLAQQSLVVSWDPQQLPLSEIFQKLASLGYDPHPWAVSAGAELLQREQRGALRELALAGIAMMQVGMFAIALHAGDIQGIAAEYRSLMRWVSLIIATVVVLYSARSFFRNAWINLRHGRLVMDLPVALAIGLAYLASAWATLSQQGQVYFDSIAMFTFFLLLGRYLERSVRQGEILRQTDLQTLLPPAATLKTESGWATIASRSIERGQVLLLKSGEVIPADGIVLSGSGSVDEAAFTGEHFPRELTRGDSVAAGTLLTEGGAEMEVTADAAGSRLASMLQLLGQAGGEKPQLARVADQVAAGFVGVVLCIAAAVACYWYLQAPERALWITLSVLVVTCPCALALATPTALTAAHARLRRQGLLLTGENLLETLNHCSKVLFDKTGTLTQGKLQRIRLQTCGELDAADCLQLAAALEVHSSHPIAAAFSDVEVTQQLLDVEVIPGQGVRARLGDDQLLIGNPLFVRSKCAAADQPPTSRGHWIALAKNAQLLAWIELADSLRPDAESLVQALQARGLAVELLTGDHSDQGPLIARKLGMDEVHSGISPQQKLAYIQQLQAAGECVAMVGDGLNDAPVLAAADCAFAVNQATDLAKSRADAILLGNKLHSLLAAFNTAHDSRRVIRQNMVWALSYNLLAIPLAASGLIPPWAAAIGMSASSLLVVLNSLRLK
ncbi:MAG: heavy metal translocating P-type ATPase [Halieaceae bacterium]